MYLYVYENNTAATLKESNHKDSPAQNFISEEGVPNTRGRVLGGSSMLTFGFYSRADDHFYKTSGVGPDNGFTVDHVQGTKVSGSTFDDSGTRHGAVELLNKANPENLHVLVHAVVDRVIFSTTKSLGAVGITYHDSKGIYHEVRVKRNGEVILSAGAIGSPQLLLPSGIGPHSYLSSLNIPVVRDHSFIGQFMADNPRTGINLLVPVTLEEGGVRVVGITKSGPYIDSAAVPKLVPPISYIPLLGSHSPLYSSVVVIGAKITKTISSGSLHLISPSDVTVSPTVRFNYHSHTKDILQCGKAVDVIRTILETRAMEEYKFLDYHGRKYFKYIGSSLPEDPSDVESMHGDFLSRNIVHFMAYPWWLHSEKGG
nr:(R)-mandelonitrile lyase-like [Tanacetum cinerariifolium]